MIENGSAIVGGFVPCTHPRVCSQSHLLMVWIEWGFSLAVTPLVRDCIRFLGQGYN